MDIIGLDLGDNSYEIRISDDLLEHGDFLRSVIRGRKVFIVTSETVASLYLSRLELLLGEYETDRIILPDGETSKSLETLETIIGALLERGHNRSTTIVALGGGVVGDIAGFAAATYQRGVGFVQIPTTLLAQVDSSVGGKTAVNHALGKNMIGAFYQPRAVLIDTSTLRSLPDRELSAGFAEVIKHGLLADRDFFDWLERHAEALLALQPDLVAHAVRTSCEIKAGVVSADEKEQGIRALLNLGHTFGHAIETAQGYGNWLHGEAVATGMVMAADLSCRTGRISARDAMRVKQLIGRFGLPVCPPASVSTGRMLELMKADKKSVDSGMRLVLLNRIGKAEIVEDFDDDKLHETLCAGEELCNG